MVVDRLPESGGAHHDESRWADLVFHALADATRRDIVAISLHEPCSVSALARRYPMSITAVQKHVNVLERAGLVCKHRHGREQIVIGQNDALARGRGLLAQLENVWRDRLDRFAHVLDDPGSPNEPQPQTNQGVTRP